MTLLLLNCGRMNRLWNVTRNSKVAKRKQKCCLDGRVAKMGAESTEV